MRTRRGICYPKVEMCCERLTVKRRRGFAGEPTNRRKRSKTAPESTGDRDLFDELPEDLVLCVLCKLSSTASCPADFINVLITYALFSFISHSNLAIVI